MAPKKNTSGGSGQSSRATTPAPPQTRAVSSSTPATMTSTTPSSSAKTGVAPKSVPDVLQHTILSVVSQYHKKTPQRTKLIDVFLAFLAVVGALQFVYCILAGNYPFNAFLSGFSATVGQFVLTVSLRIQTNEANKSEFPAVSPERSFADFVVGSMILHSFCVNFIN